MPTSTILPLILVLLHWPCQLVPAIMGPLHSLGETAWSSVSPDVLKAFSSPTFFRAQFKATSSEKPSLATSPRAAPWPWSLPPTCFRPPPTAVSLISTCNNHFTFSSQLKINRDPYEGVCADCHSPMNRSPWRGARHSLGEKEASKSGLMENRNSKQPQPVASMLSFT